MPERFTEFTCDACDQEFPVSMIGSENDYYEETLCTHCAREAMND